MRRKAEFMMVYHLKMSSGQHENLSEREKSMKKAMMVLGAVLAWAVGGFAATDEGVQLWENGPLWVKTNVGANSPTETGYYFW